MMTAPTGTHLLRWVARVWSIGSIGVLLLFLVGEGFNPTETTPAEWVGLSLFPAGMSLGMVLAWRWEGVGGALTVGSLLAFYGYEWLLSGSFPRGWGFVGLAAPGALFLGCWWLERHTPPPSPPLRAMSDRCLICQTRQTCQTRQSGLVRCRHLTRWAA
ncbi:MAG: hypothetical protein HC884_00580 [Chloroflexaceae bacterium]|nr:hypothetical protein [Chloroflexaceae bacterium]